MRGSLFRVLLAVSTALAFGAGAAHATPFASSYVGSGGTVPTLNCASSHIGGDLDITGTYLANVEVAKHQNCHLYFWVVTVASHLPWQMTAISQVGTVTTYGITGISATIASSGCTFSVAGTAGASYDSATSVLTVTTQSTAVTTVSPVSNCLGLVTPGQPMPVLSNSYAISLF
jgi:hypothetical protein